jgi:hypothetical protein
MSNRRGNYRVFGIVATLVAVCFCFVTISDAFLAGRPRLPAPPEAPAAPKPTGDHASGSSREAGPAAYGSLPLSFERNQGQAGREVRFISHGPSYSLFLTPQEAVLAVQGREQSQDQSDRALRGMKPTKRKLFESGKLYRGSPRFRKSRKVKMIRVTLAGADPNAIIESRDELPGKINYFIGNDPARWQTGIPTFERVRYAGIYPGIDLVYYGKGQQLEFDFVLAPNADPRRIGLRMKTDGQVAITKSGNLHVGVGSDSFELQRPEIYQVKDGRKLLVAGKFVQRRDGIVGFQLGRYDHSRQLIIDPILAFSTYLGGNGTDDASGIAVDSSGNSYVVGQTTSTNFPAVNGYSTTANGEGIAFVSKLSPDGTTLLYSTYLGGTGGEVGNGIALDPGGNVYVTGYTLSSDFPIVNGFQTATGTTMANAFVARIDTTQSGASSLVYSTYLGGGGNSANPFGDVGFGIAADASGLAYVTGQTTSDSSVAPFPTTATAYQTSLGSQAGNAFLTVLDTNQAGAESLVYSTYLGGSSTDMGDGGLGVVVDSLRNAYITGETTSSGPNPFPTTPTAYQASLNSPAGNVFVTEIATTQSGTASLVYSTYLGGSGATGDVGFAIALDSAGRAYVSGAVSSSDFPVTGGAYQTVAYERAFVAKMDLTQSGTQSLVYSTFLGGTNGDEGRGISVDAGGDAVVAGTTASGDFPTTSDALQTILGSPSSNAFLSKINATGTGLLYSTYIGGSCADGDSGNSVGIDLLGNAYIAGSSCSTDFPVTASKAYQTSLTGAQNAFVAKLAFNPDPGITASVAPPPNGNGWNNSNVTVSFACIPGAAPIQSCTSPVNISSEGANQTVSGGVTDTSDNSATATLTVNLDLTPPVLSITSPANPATVNTPYVVVAGTITDALSGAGGVLCNGAPASVTGSNFSCTVLLNVVSNSISVTGVDLAGNSATMNTAVTVSMQSPTSLQISPGPVTVTVGNSQSFTVIDQNGVRRPDASWSVSNMSVGTMASDGSGTFTAAAVGQETLTATVSGVSAQTTITVISGAPLSFGMTIWSAPAVAGYTTKQMVQAVPSVNGPDVYAIDTDSSGDVLVRAFMSDGEQVWQNLMTNALAIDPISGAIGEFATIGDNAGGLLFISAPGPSDAPDSFNYIRDLNAQTGQQVWQFSPTKVFYAGGAIGGEVPIEVAVGLDGKIFIVESSHVTDSSPSAKLDIIDGNSGALSNSISLPVTSETSLNDDCQPNSFTATVLGNYGPPAIGTDGSAYILISSAQWSFDWCSGNSTNTAPLQLLSIHPDGSTQYQTLDTGQNINGSQEPNMPYPQEAIPDGRGGILASWTGPIIPGLPGQPNQAGKLEIADIGTSGTVQSTFPSINIYNLGDLHHNDHLVLGPNDTAFITDGIIVQEFNSLTMQQGWTYSSTGGDLSFQGATTDGGASIEDGQLGFIQLSYNGNASQPVAGFQQAIVGPVGSWFDYSSGVPREIAGPDVDFDSMPFAQAQGDLQAQRSGKANLVHFLPVNVSEPPQPLMTAQAARLGISDLYISRQAANEPVFYINDQATFGKFVASLNDHRLDAVAFIGHSLDLANQPPATGFFSVGLCFYNFSCFSSRPGQLSYDNNNQPHPAQYVPALPLAPKVVFVASCFPGNDFLSLWSSVSGKAGHVLVIPDNPSAVVGLLNGTYFYDTFIVSLLKGKTVNQAVQDGNKYLDSLKPPVKERWKVFPPQNGNIVINHGGPQ